MKSELHRGGVRFRIYKQDVAGNAGSEDTSFLPKVGKRGWILITADWHQRTRPREIADMQKYRVRHFAFPGNLGATAMARLLVSAKNNVLVCCRDNEPFISANISKDGSVRLIRDNHGSLHDRGIEKVYKRGKLHTVAARRAGAG